MLKIEFVREWLDLTNVVRNFSTSGPLRELAGVQVVVCGIENMRRERHLCAIESGLEQRPRAA